MRWPFSKVPEIVDRPHDALAEHVMPQTVDEDACRQRIPSRSCLLGQLQPPTLCRTERTIVKQCQTTPRDRVTGLCVTPSFEQRLIVARSFQHAR